VIDEISAAAGLLVLPPDVDYTAVDRYRDFRAVLTGDQAPTAEQKARILHQILSLCDFRRDAADTTNVNETYLRLGKQRVANDLLDALTIEPQPDGGIVVEREPQGVDHE